MRFHRWALVAALLVATSCSRSGRGSDGPSIVLISIDTLRADALGCYGEKRPTSPHLDAFARESVRFTRAIAQDGVTSPSHASVFTSLYPIVHKVRNSDLGLGNGLDDAGKVIETFRLDRKIPTIASVLRDAGYRTAAFVGGGNVNHEVGLDQGFDLFDDAETNGMNGDMRGLFDPSRALAWAADHAHEKVFLFLHTYIPHSPYLPPSPWDREFDPDYTGKIPTNRDAFFAEAAPEHADRERRFWGSVDPNDPRDLQHLKALYAGDVRYADSAFDAILAGLRRAGLVDDAIVVVLSDHGEEFLEHGAFEHPGELYEELAHVPLLIHLPRAKEKGRSVDATVQLIDVFPTLLDLVDAPIPRNAQGRSLLPLLRGQSLEPLPAVSEHVFRWETRSAEDRTVPMPQDLVRTVREGNLVYVQRIANTYRVREELYDRCSDPREQHDLLKGPGYDDVLAHFRDVAQKHDERCRDLAAQFDGGESAELSRQHVEELKGLGYIK
ncbi:MAG: sulfatase [Planctomycetes bacterium]|nr:sulfatase [Planctomycetota bacterium]